MEDEQEVEEEKTNRKRNRETFEKDEEEIEGERRNFLSVLFVVACVVVYLFASK